jgi:hypothetical protein
MYIAHLKSWEKTLTPGSFMHFFAGLHVLFIMFTGYMFGYAIVRSQFPDYPAMVCAHSPIVKILTEIMSLDF